MFEWGCKKELVNESVLSGLMPQHCIAENLVHGVRMGHARPANYYIERDLKHSSMGPSMFNKYHHEALTRGSQLWKDPIREASAQKRGPLGMTPLHCACVNPNVSALRQLYEVCPNVGLADDNLRKPVHYAAACSGCEPLK